jgi:hypothetical protein
MMLFSGTSAAPLAGLISTACGPEEVLLSVSVVNCELKSASVLP